MILVSPLDPFKTEKQRFCQINGLLSDLHLRDNRDLARHVFLPLPDVPLHHLQFGFCDHDGLVAGYDRIGQGLRFAGATHASSGTSRSTSDVRKWGGNGQSASEPYRKNADCRARLVGQPSLFRRLAETTRPRISPNQAR